MLWREQRRHDASPMRLRSPQYVGQGQQEGERKVRLYGNRDTAAQSREYRQSRFDARAARSPRMNREQGEDGDQRDIFALGEVVAGQDEQHGASERKQQ